MIFVVDCSVAASWLLPDEWSAAAEELLRQAEGDSLIAPFIWPAEVRNVILVAERRRRVDKTQRETCLQRLSELPVAVLQDAPPDVLAGAFDLAGRFNLSFYDALYLRLADSLALPLATFDQRLARAAVEFGVRVLDGSTNAAPSP